MAKNKNNENIVRNPLINVKKELDFKVNIKCKNKKQKEFLKLLKSPDKTICFGIGSAGSGKSYISLAYALEELTNMTSLYNKIVCFVPTCEAGEMSIGFLKGYVDEKIEPYVQCDTHTMVKILDNSGNTNSKKIINNLVKEEIIQYELVNFVRGKTFDNTIVLINESENYSKEELLLLLTRLGENSKIIISGDLQQLDRKDIKSNKKESGLDYAVKKLNHLNEFGLVQFTHEDIVRNPLISKIINAWEAT